MKNIVVYSLLFLLIHACVKQEQASKPSEYLAFTGVTIIDGKGNPPQPNMVVVLKDDLIYSIAKNDRYKFQTNTEIIDSKGKYLIPGIIDTHAHATVLSIDNNKNSNNKYDKEASLASLKTMLTYGITTIRNPAAPTADGVELRNFVKANGKIPSPDIYTSGAALNRVKSNFGPFAATPTKSEVRKEVRNQAKAGVDVIKIYSSLKPHLVKAAIDEAHKNKIKVVGHFQNTSWTEAANLGIDFITHAAPWHKSYLPSRLRANYRPTFLGRLFWLENVDYESAEIIEMLNAIKQNNVAVDPTLVAFHTKFWGNDPKYTQSPDLKLAHPKILNVWKTATFVDNWTEKDFLRAQSQWDKLAKLTKLMHKKGILITTGSDFPNPWVLPGKSIHQEMKLLSKVGISNLEVLKIATYNGAISLGVEDKKGSIEKGKIADMIILNKNPISDIDNTLEIDLVIKSGRVHKQNN